MATRNKRTQIDADTTCNKKSKNSGDGSGNEFVVPADFTSDLLDIVCSHLPVLSAARMSLVSSRFRDLWKHCRNMVFDETTVGGIEHLEVLRVVHLAMHWHQGLTIDKFSIFICPRGIKSILDEWLAIAVAKNVKEIELDYSPSQGPMPLGMDLSGAHSVMTLKLINVELERPRRIQQWAGMANLKDLRLRSCELTFFEAVFSGCRRLEYLEILNCKNVGVLCLSASRHRNFRTLKIGGCVDLEEIQMNARTLRSFYYQGSIRRIVIQGHVPQLERVFISYIPAKAIMPENLFTKLVISSATSLSVLSLNSVFLEVMRPVATKIIFPNLTELQIFMETDTYQAFGDVLSMLARCPRLETLLIDLDEGGGFFRMLETSSEKMTDPQPFHHLKFLKIRGFESSQQERDLLEYLVIKSAALQTLALVTSQRSHHPDPSELLRHLRIIALSPLLKISVYSLDDDQSCISPSHSKTWYV